MARRFWGVSAVVIRYTGLLAVLFSLPLVTFVVVNGVLVSRMVEDNLIDSYARQLERTTAYLDEKVGRLRSVVQAITQDESLRGFWHTHREFDSGSGLRALSEFGTVNGFFDHIVLYSRDRSYLLSNQTSSYPKHFYTKLYSRRDWNVENIRSVLESINDERAYVLQRTNGGTQSIAVFMPVPTTGPQTRGHIAFIFSHARIDKLITSRAEEEMSVYLFGEDRALLYTSRKRPVPGVGALSDQLEAHAAHRWTATIELGDQEFLFAADTMDGFGWRVMAVSPKSVAISHVVWLRNLLLIVVVVLVGLGMPMIYAIIRHLHRPLRHLADSLGRENLYDSHTDEWQTIETFVHDLRSENVQLRTMRSFSEVSAVARLYLRLLRGQFGSFDEFQELSRFTDRESPKPGCFVCLVGVGSVTEEDPLKKQDMVTALNAAPTSECSFVALDALNRSIIPIVVQDQREDDGDTPVRRGVIEYLQGIIHNRLQGTFPIGVGSACRTARDVPVSLDQARQALRYGFVYPEGSIIPFADIESREELRLAPPRKLFERFRESFETLNVRQITQALDTLVHAIKESHYSMRVVDFVLFEIMGTVWERVVEGNLPRDKAQQFFVPLSTLEHVENIDVFRDRCVELISGLIAEARYDEPHLRNRKRVQDIVQFLNDSYCDDGLTLASVAERFGMSPTNLTHHFKSKIGKTVMAYLDDVRMDHAKRLLMEADMPVSEIVRQVGYVDVSNFIKKFKKYTGTTPGRYRSDSLRVG